MSRNKESAGNLPTKDNRASRNTKSRRNRTKRNEQQPDLTKAAVMLAGSTNKKRKGNRKQTGSTGGKKSPRPRKSKKNRHRTEPSNKLPTDTTNRNGIKSEASRKAVMSTVTIRLALQKDKIQQTEDNKDWIRWGARTEGDNVRRAFRNEYSPSGRLF
jgi:hypothetical protein